METQASQREGKRLNESYSLHHVAVVVSNVGRAVDFYRKVFSFPEIDRPESNHRGAWFLVGGAELHLQGRTGDSPKTDQHFAVLAPDVESIAQRASENGGRSQESKPLEGYSKRYFVYDPDGNRIELIQL